MRIGFSILLLLFLSLHQAARGESLSDSVKVFNAGVNGNTTVNLLARLERDVLSKKPGLVILMVGTNDMLHTDKSLTMAQYEQNYQELITRIRKESDVVLMTIPPIYVPYVIQRKPQFQADPTAPQKRIDSANQVIRALATRNKCVLLDLNKILTACGGADTTRDGLFQNEANIGIADGVHPNPNGYRVIATAVYQTVLVQKPGTKSVVCFGDSITCGYRVKGQGKAEGETYPAVLNRLLNQ